MRKAHPQDVRAVKEYVLNESPPGEVVRSVEKVGEEALGSERYEVYDVRTRRQRWWVITNLTNLYSQRDFPTWDEAFTTHLGLMRRIAERHQPWGTREEIDRLAGAWRRWSQASEAMDAADEAEDFQSVGMRCREALVSFVHDVADPSLVPIGHEAPKRSDVDAWARLIADAVAPDRSNERIRAYLKATAAATWALVNWLTHAKSAVRMDATVALDATGHCLYAFGMTIIRKEQGIPDRCPECSSYRLARDWRPEYGPEHEYVTRCGACEWQDLPTAIEPNWDRVPEHLRV